MHSAICKPLAAHRKNIMAEVKLAASDSQARSGFVRELEDKGAIIAIDGQVVCTLVILCYVSLPD